MRKTLLNRTSWGVAAFIILILVAAAVLRVVR